MVAGVPARAGADDEHASGRAGARRPPRPGAGSARIRRRSAGCRSMVRRSSELMRACREAGGAQRSVRAAPASAGSQASGWPSRSSGPQHARPSRSRDPADSCAWFSQTPGGSLELRRASGRRSAPSRSSRHRAGLGAQHQLAERRDRDARRPRRLVLGGNPASGRSAARSAAASGDGVVERAVRLLVRQQDRHRGCSASASVTASPMRGIRGRFAWQAAASAIRCQRTVRGLALDRRPSRAARCPRRPARRASRSRCRSAGRSAPAARPAAARAAARPAPPSSSTSPPPTTRAVQMRPSPSATSTSSPGPQPQHALHPLRVLVADAAHDAAGARLAARQEEVEDVRHRGARLLALEQQRLPAVGRLTVAAAVAGRREHARASSSPETITRRPSDAAREQRPEQLELQVRELQRRVGHVVGERVAPATRAPSTPLTAAFSRVAATACGSWSNAVTGAWPRRAAAIASTPEPQPMSSSAPRGARVAHAAARAPPGSSRARPCRTPAPARSRSRRARDRAASHGGPTQNGPTTTGPVERPPGLAPAGRDRLGHRGDRRRLGRPAGSR